MLAARGLSAEGLDLKKRGTGCLGSLAIRTLASLERGLNASRGLRMHESSESMSLRGALKLGLIAIGYWTEPYVVS
jgi:hypothetical protein